MENGQEAYKENSGRRYTYVERDEEGRIRDARAATQEEIDICHAYQEKLRKAYLETVPSREEGIDMQRVDRFLEAQGLPSAQALLIDLEDLDTLRDAFKSAGLPTLYLDDLGQLQEDGAFRRAQYIAIADVVIMIRDRESETLNGPEFTEAYLVHEKAHKVLPLPDVTFTKEADGNILIEDFMVAGFAVLNEDLQRYDSQLYEEGWPELMAARYVREELGWPDGILGTKYQPHELDLISDQMKDKLPMAYLWLSKTGVTFRSAAYAAYALELLMEREPKLENLFEGARTDATHTAEVHAIVDDIYPGLDYYLSKLPYTMDGFAAGVQRVESSLLASA